MGTVAMWKFVDSYNESSDLEDSWSLQPLSSVNGAIKQIHWGTLQKMVAINTVRDIYILKEQVICAHYKDQVRRLL